LTLEGGYNLDALTDSIATTIIGVEEEDPPVWEYAGDAGPVEAARKALAPYWENLR
jgi:acetoin utilization deacetylase AcuC-like enzyme